MPLESKQHADLVRHRELNALRRLMVQRGTAGALPLDQKITQQSSVFTSSNAIHKIDALEAQMSQQLFEHSVQTRAEAGGFQLTQIEAFESTVQATQSMAIQLEQPSTVQQAGEHFANNKVQLAQNILEQAIGERGLQHDRVPTWLALFDLYRASEQLDRFEALALDFSIRFGRSPPSWISFLQQAVIAEREHEHEPIHRVGLADWTAPAVLSQNELSSLETAVQAAIKAPRQLVMDWSAFAATDKAQWQLLKSALHYLASQSVHCSAHGILELEQSFDAQSAESTLARLALLRCQNRAQMFEDAAIDYSVQFEISPPDWIRPECRLEAVSGMSLPVKAEPAMLQPELYGALDAAHAVKLLAELVPTDGMVIRCDRLVRCDPVATMAIARFAQAAKAQGMQLELQGVHRLIAAYFAMQNFHDNIKVTIRRD